MAESVYRSPGSADETSEYWPELVRGGERNRVLAKVRRVALPVMAVGVLLVSAMLYVAPFWRMRLTDTSQYSEITRYEQVNVDCRCCGGDPRPRNRLGRGDSYQCHECVARGRLCVRVPRTEAVSTLPGL